MKGSNAILDTRSNSRFGDFENILSTDPRLSLFVGV